MVVRGQTQARPNAFNMPSQIPIAVKPPLSRDQQNFFQSSINPTSTPIIPYSRHNHYDFSRHPYTVSLDRNKETSLRDWSRDPLKEIKENKKEAKSTFSSRKSEKNEKKTKRETAQWFKPKLFNEDLYLPNLLTGKKNKQIKLYFVFTKMLF